MANSSTFQNTTVLISSGTQGPTGPQGLSSSWAIANDGTPLDLNSLAQTLSYNADNTLNYVQVVSGGNTYQQTMTWTSGKLTGVSNWVKQ